MPVSVTQLINIEYDWNYITNEPKLRGWIPPRTVSHEQRNQILQALERANQVYPEATKKWLGGRVATLLAHYFVVSADETLNTAIAVDWLESLRDIPQDFVRRAIEHWRDNETRKPKPADIRLLAKRLGGKEYAAIQRLRILALVPLEGENNERQSMDNTRNSGTFTQICETDRVKSVQQSGDSREDTQT